MGPERLTSVIKFFVQNRIVVRPEERVALAVKRPQSFIVGSLPA